MNLASVFISSIQREYAQPRQAARGAVESLGLRAVMAENAPASTTGARTALLRLIEDCDAFILIVGPAYGEVTETGRSATEDEFDHARSLGKPILVFVDDCQRDAAQEEFLARVQGTWGSAEGKFAPRFCDTAQLVALIVRSLLDLQTPAGTADTGSAQAQAIELARGDARSRGMGGGARVRVAFVPVGGTILLDALSLEDSALPNHLMDMARRTGLVPQASGIEHDVRSEGIRLSAPGTGRWDPTEIVVGADGTILVEGDVAAEGMMGSSQLHAERIETLISIAVIFAAQTWQRIDRNGRIRQVAAAAGVPDASYKAWVTEAQTGSVRMPMHSQQSVAAPEPALVARREDVASPGTTQQLVAALRRAFADAGAIQ